jgi:hypothetical protein
VSYKGLLKFRQPADSPPQGNLRAPRLPRAGQVRKTHPPGGTRPPARRHQHRQATRVGARARRTRLPTTRPPTR